LTKSGKLAGENGRLRKNPKATLHPKGGKGGVQGPLEDKIPRHIETPCGKRKKNTTTVQSSFQKGSDDEPKKKSPLQSVYNRKGVRT